MSFTHIIFDLDGTLSDPLVGINNSLNYSLTKMGITEDFKDRYNEFVGPPLHDGFTNVIGLSVEDADKAVEYFREYYGTKGLYENKLYTGITSLLQRLKKEGKYLYVATSKLERFAKLVLTHHQIDSYFDLVSGASYKGNGASKASLVARIIETIPDIPLENIIMVGDTVYDVYGANENEISSIGILYGYGNKHELQNAGARHIAENLEQLEKLLCR